MQRGVHGRRRKRGEVGTIADCSFRNGTLSGAGTLFVAQDIL